MGEGRRNIFQTGDRDGSFSARFSNHRNVDFLVAATGTHLRCSNQIFEILMTAKVLRRVKCKLTPCFMSRCNP